MSSLDMPAEFEDTYIGVEFRDPNEDDMPSMKFGWWFFLALFGVIILLASVMVAAILYCSNKQERHVEHKKRESVAKQEHKRRSSLTCRPFGMGDEDLTEQMEASDFSTSSYYNEDVMSSVSSASDDDDVEANVAVDVDDIVPQPSTSCCDDKNGSVCALCDKEYELGQPVYESNNPQCGHQFHKVCMDKWLGYQNTCPICNQHFVLQTV